jgi:LysM repeat protein
MFSLLYPDAEGAVGPSDSIEMANIIGNNVVLTGGAQSQMGRVTGVTFIDITGGYENLPIEHKEILSIATVEDVVGKSYALYQYTGTDATLDLKEQDFSTGPWQKLTPDFKTSTDTTPVQITIGQTVLVQSGPAYDLYRYVGISGLVDLARQTYSDEGSWEKVTRYVTSDGEEQLNQGDLVENMDELEYLTLEVWNDIDLAEPDSVTIVTGDGVAMETEGDFNINYIEAGGDVRLKAGNAIIELDASGTTASITTGDLILVAENELTGYIGTQDNPITVDLKGTSTLSARAGQDIYVEALADLYLNIVDAVYDVDLVAQGSIYDGIDSKESNLRAENTIHLHAIDGGIGTFDNDVDFDMTDSDSWFLEAEAEKSVFLAKTGGELVIGEANIKVTSHSGDVGMSVTDWGGSGDNLILRGAKDDTKVDTLYSPTGSVILRGGDRVLIDIDEGSDDSIHAIAGIEVYGDYYNADPGIGGEVVVWTTILRVPVHIFGESDGDLITLNNVTYTDAGQAPEWTIDGRDGGDEYVVNLTGTGKSEINVIDTGTVGQDKLIVNGTVAADTFLLRKDFVALLRPDGRDHNNKPKYNPDFERVRYDLSRNIDNQLIVNSYEGDDIFALDDNSAKTTINTGSGKDTVQIGQMFKSIPPGMTEPEDITSTTLGYLTNGVSFETTVNAGEGDDYISVYRNRAELKLYGEDGDDTFVVRAFVQEKTFIEAGAGADIIEYAINAPVDINGGDGLDTFLLIGSEFGDDLVITDQGVYGAGLTTTYDEIEMLVIDAYIGDDRIFILSTNKEISTVVLSSFGSDTINVGGVPEGLDLNDIIITAEPVEFIVTNTLEPIAGPLRLEGGTAGGEGARPITDPVNMPGEGEDDPSFGPDELILQLDETKSHDILNVYNQNSETDDEGWLESDSLTGLKMSEGTTIYEKEYPGGFLYNDMEEMNITMGYGEDTLNIRSTHAGTTYVNTADSDDKINVGSLASVMNNGVVDGIAGLLTIDSGSGEDDLNVDDTGDTDDNTGTLTGSSLTGLDMPEGIVYFNVEHLHINLGSGNDTFNVQGTTAETTVKANDGNDVFNVSSDAPANNGTLDYIEAKLKLYGGEGIHTLNVSDSGDPDPDAVLITQESIVGLAPAIILYYAAGTFGNGINIHSGTGDDNIFVDSTLKGSITLVYGNDGNDSIVTGSLNPDENGFLVMLGEGGADMLDASASSLGIMMIGDYGKESSHTDINGETVLDTIATENPGKGGDDTLIGGSGNDVMLGGAGSDTFYGDFGEDIMIGEYARVTFHDNKAKHVVTMSSYGTDLIANTLFGLYGSPFTSNPLSLHAISRGGILPSERVEPEARGITEAARPSYPSHSGSYTYIRPPAPLVEEGPAITPEEYVVKKGDTLWNIAEDKLGDPFLWPEIQKINPGIVNADIIYPGQVILIPVEPEKPRESTHDVIESGYREDGDKEGQDNTEAENDLEMVAAGLTGWGVSSSIHSGRRTHLDRKAFRKMEKDEYDRRFIRW